MVAEPESEALQRFLRSRRIRVTSSLAKVEVRRAVRFQGKPADDRVTKILARIRLLTLDNSLLDVAAALDARVCAAWTPSISLLQWRSATTSIVSSLTIVA